MAEQIHKDKLLPSLLDRLTDKDRQDTDESRDQRIATLQNLRKAVLRDLVWLMNTVNLESSADLADYPLLRASVINFGMPALSGNTKSNTEQMLIQRQIKTAIQAFEPRISGHSVRVTRIDDDELTGNHRVAFQIEGTLWGNPMPEQLFLRTEVDLELGEIKVSEA